MAKMGRKPIDGVVRETVVSFKVSEEESKRIERLAKSLEVPKTVLMRNLLLDALDDAEILDKIGALKIAKGIKKTSEFIKEYTKIKSETNNLKKEKKVIPNDD